MVRFANFTLPFAELIENHMLRDPKLPNVFLYLLEIVFFAIGDASCVLFLVTLKRTKCFHLVSFFYQIII
jgi:hypothetical protein